MAFHVQITTGHGVTASYWRVELIEVDNVRKQTRVVLCGWRDEQAYREGLRFLEDRTLLFPAAAHARYFDLDAEAPGSLAARAEAAVGEMPMTGEDGRPLANPFAAAAADNGAAEAAAVSLLPRAGRRG